MRSFLALAAFSLTLAQKAKGKVAVAETAPPTPLSKVDASTEKASILAMQVQSSIDAQAEANGGNIKGTVVDLVLQSLNMNFTATCSESSKDYLTCANGYVSLDCVFQQSAASFGGVNCIPYLSQCNAEMMKFCQDKVPAADKCKSKTACDCAQEPGCGWSRGHEMCLVNRPQVTCGDCPTMTRCGTIDCLTATRPCDCVALGGQCGWSTSSWRCEAGKDTDCNECSEQSECGGPGVEMVHQANCPAKVPSQLAACSGAGTLSCSYDKQCCPRCGGQKQVCTATRAECDGQAWEIRTQPLVCPECGDYYYEYEGEEAAPSEPRSATVSKITSNSVQISWQAPEKNFDAAVGSYSLAYAEDVENSEVEIMDPTTTTRATLSGLKPNTAYKASILPLVNEVVGKAATVEFKTAAAGKTQAKAKAKATVGKATAGKAKAG